MKTKPKTKEVRVWESFMIVQDEKTWVEIDGDGFRLEGKLYELRGRYPSHKFEIIPVLISPLPPTKKVKSKEK